MGLSVGEDVSFMIIVFSSLLTFNPLKRFRVAFFFLCWRRRVYSFLHGLREPGGGGVGAGATPPISNEASKRASKAISQGISFCVLEKMFLLL